MPTDFLMPERRKIHFGGKINMEKKIQKNFIVNNDNETIRTWYLSSK